MAIKTRKVHIKGLNDAKYIIAINSVLIAAILYKEQKCYVAFEIHLKRMTWLHQTIKILHKIIMG